MIELTIKRTNGDIEKVQREGGMTDIMFGKMQEATSNAGRGEILSWELVDSRTGEERETHRINDMYAKAETLRNTDHEACIKLIGKADAASSKSSARETVKNVEDGITECKQTNELNEIHGMTVAQLTSERDVLKRDLRGALTIKERTHKTNRLLLVDRYVGIRESVGIKS